jgi:hypothetical protein
MGNAQSRATIIQRFGSGNRVKSCKRRGIRKTQLSGYTTGTWCYLDEKEKNKREGPGT